MVKVLFICTGNHCRSPMAEAWFRHLCDYTGVTDIQVASAGTRAMVGAPAHASAIDVMRAQSIDLRPFRGQQLDKKLVRETDLLIPMAASHRDTILMLDPTATERIIPLMSFVDEAVDLTDPLGGAYEDFTHCLETMKPALEALFFHITTPLSEEGPA